MPHADFDVVTGPPAPPRRMPSDPPATDKPKPAPAVGKDPSMPAEELSKSG